MGLTVEEIEFLQQKIKEHKNAVHAGFNAAQGRKDIIQYCILGHGVGSSEILKKEVAELDNYDTYKKYASLGVGSYRDHVNGLKIALPSKKHLIDRYNGLLQHIGWCIDYAVDMAERKPSENQLENIKATIKKLLIKITDGAAISDGAWAIIEARIEALINTDSFKENVARIDIQLLIDDHASSYYEGAASDKAGFKRFFEPLVKAKVGANVYDAKYKANVAAIVNQIDAARTAGLQGVNAAVTDELDGWVSTQITEDKFWDDLVIDKEKYPIDFQKAPFNNLVGAGQKLLQADEDPLKYALKKLLKTFVAPSFTQNRAKVADVTDTCKDIEIPGHTYGCGSDQYTTVIQNDLEAQFNNLLASFYGNAQSFEKLSELLKNVSPSIHKVIYQCWNTKQVTRLDMLNQQEDFDSSADGEGKKKLDKLAAYEQMLKKDKTLTADARMIALNKYCNKYQPPIPVVVQQSDLKTFLRFGPAVKDAVWDYCHGVVFGAGMKGKATNFSKIFAPMTAIKGAVDGLQSGLDKAKEGEPFFEGEDHKIDWSATLTGAAEAGEVLLDFLTGAGIAVAVVGIKRLGGDAIKMFGMWKKAKKNRRDVAAEIAGAESSEVAIPSGRLVKLRQRYTALTLATNNHLRRFITAGVEILKRLIGIVGAVLKLMGVTYLFGLSLSLLKSVMHLFQNAYYMGRAIYKRMKGIKGVARRETAAFFVQEAIKGEPYALTIMLDSKILGASDFDKFKFNDGEDKVTDYKDLSSEIKIYNFLAVKANDESYGYELQETMKSTLFGILASKPTADLRVTMFPGLGAIKGGLAMGGVGQ